MRLANMTVTALTAAVFCYAAATATLTSASAATEAEKDARIAALQKENAKLHQENEALKAKKKEIAKLRQENVALKAKDDPNAAYATYMPTKGPVLTQSPISGYIGLYGGGDFWNWGNSDLGLYHGSDAIFGGNARVNLWLAPSYSVQLDLDAEATSKVYAWASDYAPANGRANLDIAAHWAWRDPSKGTLGVFGVIAKSANIYYDYYNGDMIEGLIGAEGQYYMGNLTLYGQAGYMGTLDYNAGSSNYLQAPQNTWFVRGVGRYFVTPNDKVQAEVGYAKSAAVCDYADCNSYGSASPSYLTWGALYEHRFAGTMWSGYVEYAGFRVDGTSLYQSTNYGGAAPVTSNNVMGGIRLHFGQPTLLAEDRNGATFDTPTFLRALNWTYLGGGLY